MTSLIRQLNAARSEQSRTLREGARRLEDLKIDSVKSQERKEEEDRLANLRESRGLNPRQTANNFGRLLENDGGIGAAIAFGITSAQADFADKINSRIQDSTNRLNELRQLERDQAQDQRISFDQQSAINAQESDAAGSDVEAAIDARDRDDRLSQQRIANERADRLADNSERQTDISARNAATSERNAATSERNSRTQERRAESQISTEEFNRQLQLIDLNAEAEKAIRELSGPESAATDAIEKGIISEFVVEADSQPGATFIEGLLVGVSDNAARLQNRGKLISENKDVLVKAINSMTPENAKKFAERINGNLDPFVARLNQNIERSVAIGIEPELLAKSRKQLIELQVFEGQIEDAISKGDADTAELNRLRQRRSLLRSALQLNSKDLESRISDSGAQ